MKSATSDPTTPPASPDARLLGLAAEIETVQARIDVMNGQQEPDDKPFDATLAEFWMLADQIVEIPARTPEGIAGKAKTLRYVHQGLSTDQTGHIARHTLGLVRDLVGEGSERQMPGADPGLPLGGEAPRQTDNRSGVQGGIWLTSLALALT